MAPNDTTIYRFSEKTETITAVTKPNEPQSAFTDLNQVGGESVRAADKPKHSRLVPYYASQLLESLPHEGTRLLGVYGVHIFHLTNFS